MRGILAGIICCWSVLAAAADSTVSALTGASALSGPELFYCVQGSADRKCTAAQLRVLAQKSVLIDVTQAPYNAACDGSTDDSTAIQAAINAVDPNRGGVVYFPQSVGCKVATGLTVTSQGTVLLGQGHPGISTSQGKGSSRIICADAINCITFQSVSGSGTHLTTGFMMRDLMIYQAAGGTSGNGVTINNTETFYAENLTVSDFIAGIGILLDGKAGSAQYAQFYNVSVGDSLTGFKTQGTAPNGWRWFGGYFAGAGPTPRVGSVAMAITTGDTSRVYGTIIQGWETGYYLSSTSADHETYGMRIEFCNIDYRLGALVNRHKMVGGDFDNSILVNTGAGNIGIQIDSGAKNVLLDPNAVAGASTAILNNAGSQVTYPTYSTSAPF